MNDKVAKEETAQTQPSTKMKIAKAATSIAVNAAVTIVVGVVTQQIVNAVNDKFFPEDQN